MTTLEELRARCLAKPGAYEDFPFGPTTLVFKVGGKMFALTGVDDQPPEVNLKCEPDLAELLRERYAAITAGYHMNKRHWNTVRLDGSVSETVLEELIDLSYELVVAGLPRRLRESLAEDQPA